MARAVRSELVDESAEGVASCRLRRASDGAEADLGVAKNGCFVSYLRRRHCRNSGRKRWGTIRLRRFVAFVAFVTHRYTPSGPGVGVCNVTK